MSTRGLEVPSTHFTGRSTNEKKVARELGSKIEAAGCYQHILHVTSLYSKVGTIRHVDKDDAIGQITPPKEAILPVTVVRVVHAQIQSKFLPEEKGNLHVEEKHCIGRLLMLHWITIRCR